MTVIDEQSTIDTEATRAFAERYAQAWNDHDLEAIMSMHAPVSAFHLHVNPYPEAETHESIREQFAGFFVIMPDMHFETARLEIRPGLFTHEWYLTATLQGPFPVGDRVAEPNGQKLRFRGVDV
ncbi:MAG: nuclear transport factor 2 family protein, partial [Acidimicrobiia bacterium]